jgi:hypothetical protein
MQGSALFVGGLVLVVVGWAIVGVILETYGFWLLFSGFFPTVLGFLRRLPVLGRVLDLPVLKTVRVGCTSHVIITRPGGRLYVLAHVPSWYGCMGHGMA